MPVFLFSDYTKSTVGENGDCPEVYGFHWNETPDGDIFLRNYKYITLKEIGAIEILWLLLLFSNGEIVL